MPRGRARTFETYADAVAREARSDDLVGYVVDVLTRFSAGEDVDLDFLAREQVGHFCRTLGFARGRNWGAMRLPQIAPTDPDGAQIVPEDEAVLILSALKLFVRTGRIRPTDDDAPSPNLLNDFLPAGTRFNGKPCLGHIWEFRYALAVELEHGVSRGTNVTNNHPLLTGMVVMAHLAEDSLYYARLWVMETEGELLQAELARKPFKEIQETLTRLATAQMRLQARIQEKLRRA